MATNWVSLTGADLLKVLTLVAQSEANQSLAESSAAQGIIEQSDPVRRDFCVAQAVEEVRSAIRRAGRFPLSATPGTVPPEAVHHTLVIAAYRLLNSTPGLAHAFLIGEGGAETAFGRMYREAVGFVWGSSVGTGYGPVVLGLAQGAVFTPPDDPVGADWKTPVSTENPPVRSFRWSDEVASDDEYAAGVGRYGQRLSDLTNYMNSY